jgi:glutathione S-transferase
MTSTYELYYWPEIPGRGEWIRLTLEAVNADYVDVARLPKDQGGGAEAIIAMAQKTPCIAPFAPPFIKHGDLVMAQTANILHYLGPKLGLIPDDPTTQQFALQLQLTIADTVAEVHATHHPIAISLTYEQQQAEADRARSYFLQDRLSKYLSYFEQVLTEQDQPYTFGSRLSYIDLSLFQLLSGLDYAFPTAMANAKRQIPRLRGIQARVSQEPAIAQYLNSERRLAFNADGIFRRLEPS